MSLIKWIENAGVSANQRWEHEASNEEYSEEEARIATVLTRMDTSLNGHILTYIAKTLDSIKVGVWVLVLISLVHLSMKLF